MKKKLRRQSVFLAVLAVVFAAVLLFAGYQALKIYLPQSSESRSFEKLKQDAGLTDINPAELVSQEQPTGSASSAEEKAPESSGGEPDSGISSLAAQNSDFVGWLTVQETDIDYPVMKSSENDPEFYLHRDFDKNYSYSGTLFIGEGCNADSDIFVIYGHNMNAGTMFGTLDSFRDPVFASEHQYILFRTPAGNRVYRVFAAFQTQIVPENSDAFAYYRAVGKLNKGEFDYAVENIQRMSLINLNAAPAYGQNIMLLSTCYYHTDDGRFVVAAYRVK